MAYGASLDSLMSDKLMKPLSLVYLNPGPITATEDVDICVALETTSSPIEERASDSPFGLTSEHHAKYLPTPHLDLGISSPLTSIGFCL